MLDLQRIIADRRFTSLGIEAPKQHVQSSVCTLARDIGARMPPSPLRLAHCPKPPKPAKPHTPPRPRPTMSFDGGMGGGQVCVRSFARTSIGTLVPRPTCIGKTPSVTRSSQPRGHQWPSLWPCTRTMSSMAPRPTHHPASLRRTSIVLCVFYIACCCMLDVGWCAAIYTIVFILVHI
jgi:hypothetical protein